MFWAVRRLFEELARDEPLIVVIEDIHWAEPKLLDLLEYLAWVDRRRAGPAPLPRTAGGLRRAPELAGVTERHDAASRPAH